ncbi:MAG: type I restriction enzyme HsdR N-terminal domain-containing protein [Oscillospiraceae bacterium]|nr:type I restriction enzyme HsdR N-terminal domain-containing protein [Oscillospiraceae bacterium]
MFVDDFHTYKDRISRYSSKLSEMTEEATKNALIMPLLILLGYDVFNPDEIQPEYICDVAMKKGEKIDYAIMRDGDPIVLIEAKRAGLKLQKQQQDQLYRYFSTNRCRIAILTNGITYNFFSDINYPNVMDDEPFISFNILEDDEELFLSSLEQFHKDNFNLKNILLKAIFLKYIKVVEQTLKQDLINPSDELVKYFLSRPEIKTNARITAQIIERHRAATAETMRKIMGVTINISSNSQSDEQYYTSHDGSSDEITEQLKSFSPEIRCRKDKSNGVTAIYIEKNESTIARVRFSVKNRITRYDFTDLRIGKLTFIRSIEECADMLK